MPAECPLYKIHCITFLVGIPLCVSHAPPPLHPLFFLTCCWSNNTEQGKTDSHYGASHSEAFSLSQQLRGMDRATLTLPVEHSNVCKCARKRKKKKNSVPYCVFFLSSCVCFSSFTHVFMLRERLPSSALGIIKAQECEQSESSGWCIKNRSTWQTLIDSHPLTFQIREGLVRKPQCSSSLI